MVYAPDRRDALTLRLHWTWEWARADPKVPRYTEEARDCGSLKYYFPVTPWYWKAVSGLGILISHYVN